MLRDRRILVVDDDARVLWVLHSTLARARDGYAVTSACSSPAALDQFKERLFDLVITDLSMPLMSGIGLTEAIRALDSDAAVIWITAYNSQDVRREAERLQVYRCLVKPLEIAEIRQVARDALQAAEIRTQP